MLSEEIFESQEMSGAFIHKISSKLEFNEGVAAISQVKDTITFQTIPVVIIRYTPPEMLRVHSKIAQTQRFKQEAHIPEVIEQHIGSQGE